MIPPSRPPLSERTLLFLLAAVQFTHIMDFMVMMPLGPQLMRLFKIGPQEFSVLLASYTFSAALAGLVGALLVDRFDRKSALLFCYAGFLVGTLACALSPTYATLLAARILSGAFGGVSAAIVLTLVGDVVPPERRASGMGVVMTAFALASVAGVPAGLWLAAVWSWHAPFLIIVTVGTVVWTVVWAVFPSLRAHLAGQTAGSPQVLLGLKSLLTHANTVTALAFMLLMVFGHFIVIPFISPSMVANAGMAERDLSLFYLVGGLSSLFTTPLVGRLADRYGRLLLFVITTVGGTVPVYLLTRQQPASLLPILTLAAAFFVFAGGRFVPGQAIITSSVPARLRGSFMSLNTSMRDFAAGGASLLGGHIVTRDALTGKLMHFPTLGWIAIAASLASIVLASRVKPVA